MPLNHELELLLARIESLSSQKRRDAIDEVLAAEPRTTAVTSLRNHDVIRRFREEMTDGLIRLDTVTQLLGLLRSVIETAVLR